MRLVGYSEIKKQLPGLETHTFTTFTDVGNVGIALASTQPPGPYATRSHIHTGPLVVGTVATKPREIFRYPVDGMLNMRLDVYNDQGSKQGPLVVATLKLSQL
jgi:hypothetical protein